MPPPLSNLGPGDRPPSDRVSWNAFVRAGRAANRNQPGVNAPQYPGTVTLPSLIVYLRNDTAGALPVYSVVKIGEPLVSAVDQPHQVRQLPSFAGSAPNSSSAFGILIEPAPVGSVVRAVVLGPVPCAVFVNEDGHQFARPVTGETTRLESAESGPARILWKYGTEGAVQAVVLLQGDMGEGEGGSSLTVTAAPAPASEKQAVRISLDLLVRPCKHRSVEPVGTEECVACGGSVKLKVYTCAAQHGTCTVAAPGKSKRMSCLKCQRDGLGFEPEVDSQ
jgi:hypothetical protein